MRQHGAHVSHRLRIVVLLAVAAALASACSGVNLDAARQLSLGGRGVASEAKQTAIASDEEYTRARDAEALFHGFSGTANDENYKKNLALFDRIHSELTKRGIVFDRLVQLRRLAT